MTHFRTLFALLLTCVIAGSAVAQLVPMPNVEGSPFRGRNILITGYWPPTNEMLRQWSPSPTQNPGHWTGENWEGRGFNLHAHFPEFPGGTTTNPKGNGDFEVDYQDTFADFNSLLSVLKPVAVISFSRANTQIGWEMEPAYTRFRLPGETTQVPGRTIPTYTQDYAGNRYPTEVANVPLGDIRVSNLPMQRVVNAVDAAFTSTQIDPFVAAYNPQNPNSFDFAGSFLSGYLPFLAARHRDANNDPTNPFALMMSGHIHVGQNLNVQVGRQAAEITLREVIGSLEWLVIPAPSGMIVPGVLCLAVLRRRL